MKLFISKRILVGNTFVDGAVAVENGKITSILDNSAELNNLIETAPANVVELHDFSDLVLMAGLIDSHVHINEPGRTEWEGFETATKAAAAGGFTTIVDMPLNSLPPTTTVENFRKKQEAAAGKTHVNVGFWGGIIPGNSPELKPLLEEGVVGFKCFLCQSGVDEFPAVDRRDVELAYQQLNGMHALIAFHAEMCDDSKSNWKNSPSKQGDPCKYATYLETRPQSLEINAIKFIAEIAAEHKKTRTHIVHLSAADALPYINELRRKIGKQLTVETCHHYLSLAAEDIPDNRVDYKCCPPIRGHSNRQRLWEAIRNNEIDLIVSDHSPSTPDIKYFEDGDFSKAWGGIASVQFGLSLFNTDCREHGLGIPDMARLMCENPAKLCGFDYRKGLIAEGFDADFCVWNPDEEFVVKTEDILFRNKATPYIGKRLRGVIYATIVKGEFAYRKGGDFKVVGELLKRKNL